MEKNADVKGSAGVSPAKISSEKNAGETPALHKAWHSRGYLPHCDVPGLLQSITFRLADALPEEALGRLGSETSNDEKRNRIETMLDQGFGSCVLNDARCGDIVEQALLYFDEQRYRLLEWCVMPNHVHVLVETMEGWALGDIVHGWKSYTAKAINKVLERKGCLWQADYFDRYIRDDAHLQMVRNYIRNNPVESGLCLLPEKWPHGSASMEGSAGVSPAKISGARNAGEAGCGRDARAPG
jgi:REP element-mobilizing transposase RayT